MSIFSLKFWMKIGALPLYKRKFFLFSLSQNFDLCYTIAKKTKAPPFQLEYFSLNNLSTYHHQFDH